ncbi:MAG: metallophosphoesterase, partial [Prevotellaceae bacterium]|nr:metallophosphoesterase [Prevotellaceae bacterium]
MAKMNNNKLIIILCIFSLLPFRSKGQTATFVLLPDTQTYLESCPEILEKQVHVIAENSNQYAALIHLGDITQDNHPLEWYVAGKLFQSFDKVKLPFTFSLGNHDIGSAPRKAADTMNTTLANQYFPLEVMK